MYSNFLERVNSNKNFVTILLIFSIAFFSISLTYVIKKSRKQGTGQVAGIIEKNINQQQLYKYTSQKYISRAIMLYAQSIIKEETASLPESSRFYAYVATTFFDIYEINNDLSATLYAIKQVINTIYPKYESKTNDITELLSKNKIPLGITGKESTKLESILEWIAVDKNVPNTVIQTKDKKGWENIAASSLESPNAGSWKHWLLTNESVTYLEDSDRPAETANQYNEEVKELKSTIKNLTPSQKNTAIFWLNIKGKEGIAGIWQNYLYDEVDKSKTSESQFAKMQKNLAVGLADTAIEVWKIKYANWSPRLQFSNPEIASLVEPPNNPRFVSEQAALSSAASEILGFYLPNQKEIFSQNAREARDSGKWGGVSLDSDDQSGFKLGKNIGIEIIKKLN